MEDYHKVMKDGKKRMEDLRKRFSNTSFEDRKNPTLRDYVQGWRTMTCQNCAGSIKVEKERKHDVEWCPYCKGGVLK